MKDKIPSFDQFEDFDFRELPIGVYMTALDGQFVVCNRTLRKMLGLPLEGPIHATIVDFYPNPMDREEAIARAIKVSDQGREVDRGILKLIANGHELYVEDYCKILKDETGEITGFVGCLVDITSEFETRRHESLLRDRVEELTFDIGRILHANTTTLVMVSQGLQSAIQALGPNPFTELTVPSSDEIDDVLAESANALASTIEHFLKVANEERRSKSLSAAKWHTLSAQVNGLRKFREQVTVAESRSSALRASANTVSQISQAIAPGFLPREAIRGLQYSANQLQRISTLIDLLKTRSAVLQMDFTLQSLREYVTSEMREKISAEKVTVKYLVDEAISRLTAFANSLSVEIQVQNIVEAKVKVNEREVVRALANLLHNAIKYTWRRDRTKSSWVSIRTTVRDGKVFIEFENWGVPISKEELDQGLIFNLGYRGRLSKDRGRQGTGIGLTDSYRIAESYGGNVVIQSRPTRNFKASDRNYYDQPFRTTVIFSLPLS